MTEADQRPGVAAAGLSRRRVLATAGGVAAVGGLVAVSVGGILATRPAERASLTVDAATIRLGQNFDALGVQWTTHVEQLQGAGHIMGTVRMGTAAAASVTDGYGRTWDHTNLWLAGSGLFPAVGTGNPTLTITGRARDRPRPRDEHGVAGRARARAAPSRGWRSVAVGPQGRWTDRQRPGRCGPVA